MRIPLIVAARPSTAKFPSVRLRSGKWTFTSDHVDSMLHVEANNLRTEVTGELVLENPATVSCSFTLVGTEPHVTVYACLTL